MPIHVFRIAIPADRKAVLATLFSWPGNEPDAKEITKVRSLNDVQAVQFREGNNRYAILCAGCHGSKGTGIDPLAPPLCDSEWVLGSEGILIRIILDGMEGPCHVNGTRYAPPKILPNMPPLKSLSDDEIAAILTYTRRAWGHEADPISAATVREVRSTTAKRRKPWTEKELLELKP